MLIDCGLQLTIFWDINQQPLDAPNNLKCTMLGAFLGDSKLGFPCQLCIQYSK